MLSADACEVAPGSLGKHTQNCPCPALPATPSEETSLSQRRWLHASGPRVAPVRGDSGLPWPPLVVS